jgi:hypothetical protein
MSKLNRSLYKGIEVLEIEDCSIDLKKLLINGIDPANKGMLYCFLQYDLNVIFDEHIHYFQIVPKSNQNRFDNGLDQQLVLF